MEEREGERRRSDCWDGAGKSVAASVSILVHPWFPSFPAFPPMNHRWSIAEAQPLLADKLARELDLPPLLARCLVNRGHTDPAAAGAFLQPRLKQLADPFLLPNMAAAVDRLYAARERGEPLVIFGDYDVDGVSSTALLVEVLRALGWRANFYLPSRFDEGYGLSREGVENCLAKFNVPLLLAVDCGSTAVETIAWLRTRGVDVIVLDHHQVSSPAPDAVALVNPQLPRSAGVPPASPSAEAGDCGQDARAPFRELCSAGLAFKLAHALVKRGRDLGLAAAQTFDVRSLLDLVALGTIADLVPLIGENRILVAAGLERLSATTRPGLVALKQVAQVEEPVDAFAVSFQLAPRLNAAGRLENATAALELLLARDLEQAAPLAAALDAHNRERQNIERHLADEIVARVRQRFDPARDYVIVEGELLWHIGVAGIVASRVLREFHRPTLILGGDGHEWRGSGRSIEGFDLAAALRECGDLLVRHGGHAMAAGVTVRPDRVDDLRARLNQLAQRTLQADQLRPLLRLDAELRPGELTLDVLDEVNALAPFGQGNPGVQVVLRGLRLMAPPQRMGAVQQHVKLRASDGRLNYEIVWWRAGDAALPDGAFDLACAPEINEFNGRRSLQLKLLDWKRAG
jgi:single-stranded-DNA-specific exonuclease